MNFIRNNFTGSFRRRQENVIENRDSSQINRGDDSDACFETYRHHCTQLEETISSYNVSYRL